MKTHIRFILVLLNFITVLATQAQSTNSRDLMIADYMYTHLAFAEAIKHYEKISDYT